MTEEEKWAAVLSCDASRDGAFLYAVRTTGIFCRPSCRSRPPIRQNVLFFDAAQDAMRAGFRPCKRCRPDLIEYEPARELVRRAAAAIDRALAEGDSIADGMREMGISARRMSALFKEERGVTMREYVDAARLRRARHLLAQTSDPVVDIALAVGFDSLSAFYRFFRQRVGTSPAAYRRQQSGKE